MAHPRDKEVRERLVARGAKELSDAELLSVLLGEGTQADSALGQAEKLLAAASREYADPQAPLAALAAMELGKLRMASSIGIKKAAAISVAIELGRRAALQQSTKQDTLGTDEDVAAMFRPLMAGLPHEEFWAVYLSSSNRIIDKVRISHGGVSATVADHKIIVKRAVERLASAIIVVHNHPSGSAEPSHKDVELTQKLSLASSLFDIALLDHIILSAGGHYSFRKNSLL